MKLCWLDIRDCGAMKDAVRTEAVHQRIDAIVAGDPADLAGLPPTVTKVLMPGGVGLRAGAGTGLPDGAGLPDGTGLPDDLGAADSTALPDDLGAADIVIVDATRPQDYAALSARPNGVRIGRYVAVTDPASLDLACRCAGTDEWTVLDFRDPTKIPLEIVLAAAEGAAGRIVTVARDVTDAEILFGVLERGSDGVLMAPAAVGDATRLKAAAVPGVEELKLTELTVTGTRHVGMGERACVDTCTYLRQDEGILVGSQARGMLLCASETHPLPYMPIRPFRVNAGAIMSYTLTAGGHTRYLSELHAGSTALAVDVHGHARVVTVGRTKIETRPLLAIDAVAADGRTVNAIVQDDWHVRVLGPDGAVLNSTALAAGDVVLGYLPEHDRHVGYPIDELCHEQ